MERVAFSLGEAFFGPGDHYLKGAGGLGMLVSVLLSNAVVIAGIVLVFLIIFAGIQMITGSGEPEKLDRARQIITAGIIGFILIISGFFIVRFLESSLGIDLLRGDPPAERLMCSDYSHSPLSCPEGECPVCTNGSDGAEWDCEESTLWPNCIF